MQQTTKALVGMVHDALVFLYEPMKMRQIIKQTNNLKTNISEYRVKWAN